MQPISYLPQLLTVAVVSAAVASQSPWGFPLQRTFDATSVNGQSLGPASPPLTIMRDRNQNALTGAGFAGCNTWNGQVSLGQSDFGVDNLGTTKKLCSEQMATEMTFLTALKAVKRWRMEGPTLVLEGDGSTMLLLPHSDGRL